MPAHSPRGAITVAALAAASLALGACNGSTSGPGPMPPPACKGIDQACGTGAECCSGSCPAGACGCSDLAARCGASSDCCDVGTPRRCETGTCVSGQRPLGDVCEWDGQCASFNCDVTGHCAAPCGQLGASCSSSAQCCGYLGCPAGTCSMACGTDYDACVTDNECCSDYRCRAGECQHGVCGTEWQRCASEADCCTAAQGGKEYFCNQYGYCDIGQPYDIPGTPPDACATDADCTVGSPCRGGYCHWADGHQADGHWCLDGQECDGGHCTSTAAGVPGTCCSGAGTACSASGTSSTVCCSGLGLACTGVAGAQRCESCLDFDNSGPQGTAETQCTTESQCCVSRNLTCVAGECCTRRGFACTAGTGDRECCAGDTCGDVTDYQGTRSNVCCGTFGARCGMYSPCCDGFVCGNDGTCHLAPGEACIDSAQCADYSGCKIETPPEGVCCGHELARCHSDADCCSGSCDVAFGGCNWAQEYGPCLDDSDCSSRVFGQWDGTVCGGSPIVGPFRCCPVPGDTCLSAADCCEVGDSCKVPLNGPSTAPAVCCRETRSIASQSSQCCTGMSERRSSTSVDQTCCALPYMTSFTCASDEDCCGATMYAAETRCDVGGTNRCCIRDSRLCPGDAHADQCCTSRVDNQGCCTLFRG